MKTSLVHNIKIFALFIIVSCGALTSKAPSAAENEGFKQAKQFLNQYIEHFNLLLKNPNDVNALKASAEDISYPAVLISPKGNKLIATEPSFVKKSNLGFLNYLAKQGIARISWQKIELKKLGSHVIIASNVANLLNQQGEQVSQTSGTYLIHKHQGRWKIYSRIQHPIEDRINLNSSSNR